MTRVYVRLEEPEKERLERAVKFINQGGGKHINQAHVMREALTLYLNELERLYPEIFSPGGRSVS
jgi:hypothetical protein